MDIMTNEYSITKRITKQGNRASISIPKDLVEKHLPPGTLVEAKIKVLGRPG